MIYREVYGPDDSFVSEVATREVALSLLFQSASSYAEENDDLHLRTLIDLRANDAVIDHLYRYYHVKISLP